MCDNKGSTPKRWSQLTALQQMGFLNLPPHPFQRSPNSVMRHQLFECKYQHTRMQTHYVTSFPIALVPFSWIKPQSGVLSSHPQVLFFLPWRKHHRDCFRDHESPITGSNRVIAIVGSDAFTCTSERHQRKKQCFSACFSGRMWVGSLFSNFPQLRTIFVLFEWFFVLQS